MQHRLNQNDVTNRVNVESAPQVRDAVLDIFAHRYPGEDFSHLGRAFDDVHTSPPRSPQNALIAAVEFI